MAHNIDFFKERFDHVTPAAKGLFRRAGINDKLLCIKKRTKDNIFSTGLKEDFFNLHNPEKTSPRTNCHVLCRWIFAEIS